MKVLLAVFSAKWLYEKLDINDDVVLVRLPGAFAGR